MVDFFSRPIPGQSLTDSPKNSPWERPPEMVETGEVVKHYITKIAKEDVMDDLAAVFEMGADLESVVETMILTGSMKGLHTVEAGMLAGPVVGTFIKSAMSSYGLDIKETMVDPQDAKNKKDEERLKRILKDYIKSNPTQDEGSELIEEMAGEETPEHEGEETPQVEQQEEPMVEEKPNGLMSKGEM